MINLVIRQATIQDCAGIQNIHRNCEDPWHYPDECLAWIGKHLERGFYIQVAELYNKIVGHGEWIINKDHKDKFLYLGMLQIDDDYQKLGIGRKMIDDGIRYAKELGCSKIVTIPDSDNTSIVFYRKCGFVTGRQIVNIALPTNNYGYYQNYTKLESVPFSIIQERMFVFGIAQASSRHMWEIYNQKPTTDDRNIESMLSESGDLIQLGWFNGNDTALVLYWHNFANSNSVKDILTFAFHLGLKKVLFRFFEEFEYLFNEFNVEMKKADIEIYRLI